MEDIYKQALLDAKAVRASAMANAKASLQEAFEPKIQEMIRLKLSEELEEEGYNEMEEAYTETEAKEAAHETKDSTMDEIDEASLEEILAELEELSGDDKVEEGEKSEDHMMEAEDEESEEETEDDSEEGETEESDEDTSEEDEVEDDTKIIDITLGDLKQVLQSVMGGSAEVDMEDLGGEESTEETDEESIKMDEVDLDEILAELDKSKKKEDEKKSEEKEEKMKKEEAKKLQEAHKTINILRDELNEVNLLNAKLLYMNKIFKSKNLSESQKINVVSALDRASNVKEAKNIYETLKETLHSKKSQIQESRGFASNPAGVAPKKVIVEADAFVSRWQKIAGIK
jgi:hypothetical protein